MLRGDAFVLSSASLASVEDEADSDEEDEDDEEKLSAANSTSSQEIPGWNSAPQVQHTSAPQPLLPLHSLLESKRAASSR